MTTLTGLSAIVTGGSMGLGRAIAESFLEAGADLLLVARTSGPLEEARRELSSRAREGQRVLAVRADVSRQGDCEEVAREAGRQLPNLEVLVNNAGIYGPMGPVEENDWDGWVETVRVNLFGPVLMTRSILPLLRRRGRGKIINLSGGGATAPLPCRSAYAASKAALVRFTETLAEEMKQYHIDVNAIAPGPLNTRLLDQVLAAGPDRVGAEFFSKAQRQREEGGVPLARGAGLALFLASPESDGITGKLLSAVWDDWERLAERKSELAETDVYTLRRIVPEDRAR